MFIIFGIINRIVLDISDLVGSLIYKRYIVYVNEMIWNCWILN